MREMIRAAFVIARRDFAAIIFSKAFFFFLLGPLFPLAIGLAAGGLSSQVAQDMDRPAIALVTPAASDLVAARAQLAERLGDRRLPELVAVAASDDGAAQIRALLADETQDGRKFVAVLTGTLDAPVLVAPQAMVERWRGEMGLIVDYASGGQAIQPVSIGEQVVDTSAGASNQARLLTAQAGQVLLFLLTMLLAGMVLSNLVEEKTNKIIEILAAAIPIDAIFLGKLFAMLAMAFVGIAVWLVVGIVALNAFGPGVPSLTPPAIGWPGFIALMLLYFTMAYLLLGSLFLGIGAMATTVREVQTLSMPVTMAQLLVFFLATYAVTKMGEPIELFAAIFPFSSPFAMLARAAQIDSWWPHLLALAWQALWTAIIIRAGTRMFRRNVMKSGKAGGAQKRSLWQRLSRSNATQ